MILLRPGQLEVSQYKNGIMAVPAVPGAGKTTCLCHLATNLIEHELNSGERILIVTVMNSAVSNFKRKMRDLLDERELPVKGFEVKTLHSLGLSILKEKPDMLLVNNAFDLLTGEERDRILGGLTDRWLNQNRDRWQPFLTINPEYKFYAKGLERWNQAIKDMVSNMITAIKLRGLSRSEWDQTYNAIVDYKDDSFIKWVIEIINDYNAYLKTSGRVDFDDLIVLAYRLLQEDEALRERMQTRWKYIFEDEAQDSTPLQEKILQLLSEKSGNLVRVGDCNQGIMGFSGTDPSLFQRFCKTAINQPITMASRSTRDIMNFANNYVSWVRTAFPLTECREALEEQLIVGAPDGDPFPNPMISDYGITIHEIDGEVSGELEFIAKQAAQAVKQFPDKTVAILVRENRFNDIIAGHLTSLDVQFESVGEGSLSSQYSLEDVKAILAFLAEPY
ncbi:MAG: UvrD-helicase domain-containing protein, partial [Acidobacteriota bacterium]